MEQDETVSLSHKARGPLVTGWIRLTARTNTKCPSDIIALVVHFVGFRNPSITLCLVGPAAVGKSTLCSRLMFDLCILSQVEFERALSSTLSALFACHFPSARFDCTVIDGPGRGPRRFANDVAHCDCVVLVVPADAAAFERAMQSDSCRAGQVYFENAVLTKLRICHAFGIRRLIVCVNVNASEPLGAERFSTMKETVLNVAAKIGFKAKRIPFVVISALNGANLAKPATLTATDYDGFEVQWQDNGKGKVLRGRTFLDAIDSTLEKPRRANACNKVLRFAVANSFWMTNVGLVVTGRVVQGVVHKGDTVRVCPLGVVATVTSIEMWHVAVCQAAPGDLVGLALQASSYKCYANV